jgi:uncharacterized protein (DUF983 family)
MDTDKQQQVAPLVALAYRCPACGEGRLNWLAFVEGDTVMCLVCGTSYEVPEEA